MACNPSGSFCPWDFPAKNTGMGCHFLLQKICIQHSSNTRSITKSTTVRVKWRTLGELEEEIVSDVEDREKLPEDASLINLYSLAQYVEQMVLESLAV